MQRKSSVLSLLCSCSLSTASRLHSNVLFCYRWIQPSCSFMGECGWYWECAATTKLYKIKVHWHRQLQTRNSGRINQKQQHFLWGWMVSLCICTAAIFIHHRLCVCSEPASCWCRAVLRIRGIRLPFITFICGEGHTCSYRGLAVTDSCQKTTSLLRFLADMTRLQGCKIAAHRTVQQAPVACLIGLQQNGVKMCS